MKYSLVILSFLLVGFQQSFACVNITTLPQISIISMEGVWYVVGKNDNTTTNLCIQYTFKYGSASTNILYKYYDGNLGSRVNLNFNINTYSNNPTFSMVDVNGEFSRNFYLQTNSGQSYAILCQCVDGNDVCELLSRSKTGYSSAMTAAGSNPLLIGNFTNILNNCI